MSPVKSNRIDSALVGVGIPVGGTAFPADGDASSADVVAASVWDAVDDGSSMSAEQAVTSAAVAAAAANNLTVEHARAAACGP